MTLFLHIYIYRGRNKFYQYLGMLDKSKVRVLDIETNQQIELSKEVFKRDYYLHDTLKISIF